MEEEVPSCIGQKAHCDDGDKCHTCRYCFLCVGMMMYQAIEIGLIDKGGPD